MTRTPFPLTAGYTAPALLRLAGLFLLCAWGLLPLAQAAGEKSGSPAQLYASYCSVCHGEKGDGKSRAQNSLNPPPRDFTSARPDLLPRQLMVELVTNGKPGTAMSAWKTQLQPQQIEAVVDYVRQTFMVATVATENSRGRALFSKNCSVCHGEKGDGKSRAQNSLTPPPRDFTAAAARTELSAQRMLNSVSFGRADTAMAGFQGRLSAEDIRAVVDYIRADFMGINAATPNAPGAQAGAGAASPHGQAAMPVPATAAASVAAPAKPVPVDMAAAMPRGLGGDVAKGGAFYMNNCATCHGVAGDGRGPRAYFINPKPRNFLHSASRQEFNRVKLFEVVSDGVRGTEMPAWKQVLSAQEIANVAEFVFQRFIQSGTEASNATQ